MLKKIKLAAVALLLPLIAFAQSYPSPTYQNVTVLGTLTAATPVFTNPLPVSSGGTGVSSFTTGNVLVGAAGGGLTTVGTSSAGLPLISSGTGFVPVWTPLTLAGGGTSATTAAQARTNLGAAATASGLNQFASTTSAQLAGVISDETGSGSLVFANSPTLTGSPVVPGYATLASPALTGTPTAPTATAGTNTTQLATTQFVTSAVAAAATTGRLIGVQVFTSSGTYTPTTGTNSVIVELVGGGGAGGGAAATGASQAAVGAGGGSAARAFGRFTSGFSGVTVTIGDAGVGVSGAVGSAGGNSSFGALMTAAGGVFGTVGPGVIANTTDTIAISDLTGTPVATGGNIVNQNGGSGGFGFSIAGSVVGGVGGSSPYGTGGKPAVNGGSPTAATGFGAGGGGAANSASLAARAGGNGSPGVCIIFEFN